MNEAPAPLPPAEFSRHLLLTIEASEGRRRKRKRDTTPDAIGLNIKRELLERAIADAPLPDEFEGWLLEQVLSMPVGSGAVRAICLQILEEYRLATVDQEFRHWLLAGAPSADADTSG
jgi:hypothetical protein